MSDPIRAEQSLKDMVEWVELWNRVCATAWGDDDKPPPPWSEVAAKELPDWNLGNMTAEGWGEYMKVRLAHHVEDYLFHLGRHPYQVGASTQPETQEAGK